MNTVIDLIGRGALHHLRHSHRNRRAWHHTTSDPHLPRGRLPTPSTEDTCEPLLRQEMVMVSLRPVCSYTSGSGSLRSRRSSVLLPVATLPRTTTFTTATWRSRIDPPSTIGSKNTEACKRAQGPDREKQGTYCTVRDRWPADADRGSDGAAPRARPTSRVPVRSPTTRHGHPPRRSAAFVPTTSTE